ncbi:hypothetical protein C4B60_03620 [Jeotgalibacillus proteolyticus]|uniref:DUF4825 domain-containing protein n=1 Tax=Jeotgalibacillus proteolyticus TaxID=2082395 RepID=A0A2S5GDV0_9BACL|nr:hypothetical protein C4B60_03620 [Jeotgalibacillus proteolyticus]
MLKANHVKAKYFALFIFSTFLLSACGGDVSDRKIQNYFKEKYNIDVKVISREEWNTGNMGDFTHKVRLKDNKNVTFDVNVSEDTVTGDNYPIAAKNYEEYKKFEKVLPTVEQLGFELKYGENFIFHEVYGSDQVKIFLDLYTSEKIDYLTFEQQQLDNYYQLVDVVRSSGADIHLLTIEDKRQDPNFISVPMKELPKDLTKDDLYLKIRQRNLDMVSTLENEEATKVTSKLETKRYEFADHYYHNWLMCGETNAETECKWYFVNVEYEQDGLNLTNEHLVSDITYIYEFLSEYLNNKPFKLNVTEPREDVDSPSIHMEYEEWGKYEDIQHLLEVKLEN